MNNIYKINSADLRIDAKEIFVRLERTLSKLNIDFYLIGALARDIVTIAKKEIPFTATADIDIAVLVSDIDEYDRVKKMLVEKEGFEENETLPYCLHFQNKKIDLLPCGGLENSDGVVQLNGRRLFSLSVLGMKELYSASDKVIIDDKLTFSVSSFPSLCILKLIAYSERPDERLKDIRDINFMVEKYADMNVEYVCESHTELLNMGWDENLSGRVFGRDIGSALKEKMFLTKKILEILNFEIERGVDSKFVNEMVKGARATIQSKLNTLVNLREGINDILLSENEK